MRIDVIRSGVTYNFREGKNSPHFDAMLEQYDGLGMVAGVRKTEQGAQQDGVSDRGFQAGGRTISLVFVVFGLSMAEYRSNLSRLVRVFKPSGGMTLRFTLENMERRSIEAFYKSDMTLGTRGRYGIAQRVGITLSAPDPFFYDPTQKIVSATLAAQTELGFPIGFPIEFGSSLILESIDVEYAGSWDEHPVVEITGPIKTPRAWNKTLGKWIELDYEVAAGEVVTISAPRDGSKTITNNYGANLMYTLTDDSDLANFRLLSAEDGSLTRTNEIELRGTEAVVGATKIELRYYVRDAGI